MTLNARRTPPAKIFFIGCAVALLVVIAIFSLAGKTAKNIEKRGDESSKPAGKIVDITRFDDYESAYTAIMLRLKQQPSREAMLNALAQEACAVTDELQRRHPNDADAQYLDPLYNKGLLLIFDMYNANSDHTDGNQPINQRQLKYCKVYMP